jgi:hypothetical protein
VHIAGLSIDSKKNGSKRIDSKEYIKKAALYYFPHTHIAQIV